MSHETGRVYDITKSKNYKQMPKAEQLLSPIVLLLPFSNLPFQENPAIVINRSKCLLEILHRTTITGYDL